MRASHGWSHVESSRKREIIDAIRNRTATSGPSHLELDLTDRCNVACYFCNQQDLRTKDQICLERVRETVDRLAETGLRSVRLSGGGDPLFHRQIHEVLDHLISKNIIIDNLTTNGVALTPEISQKLVDSQAREVIVSLNAPNAEHYHRMLRVKPQLFDKVLENVRSLVKLRGDAEGPSVVIQFLLDRPTLPLLPQSYDLASSILGRQDRIAVGLILPVRGVQLDEDVLLHHEDVTGAEPVLREVLAKDRDRGLLQIDFPYPSWSALDRRIQDELQVDRQNLYPTAASFQEENSGCFFPWYTAAVTGNGDVRPCCLLLNPEVPPLGNINETPLPELWHGPRFGKFREEMREVLLKGSDVPYDPERFEIADRACTEATRCWLKNMFFRGDEEFYAELGAALDEARREDERPFSKLKKRIESILEGHSRAEELWRSLGDASRPLRAWIKKNLRLNVTEMAIDDEPSPEGFFMIRYLVVQPDPVSLQSAVSKSDLRGTAFLESIPESILKMSGHTDFIPIPGEPVEIGEPGRVRLLKKEADDVELMINSKQWGLLVTRESYSTSWRAYWNSKALPPVEVNGAYLGTFVPPGKSLIRLRCESSA